MAILSIFFSVLVVARSKRSSVGFDRKRKNQAGNSNFSLAFQGIRLRGTDINRTILTHAFGQSRTVDMEPATTFITDAVASSIVQ